jgi:membrane associated rhomboid family serine protease
MTRLSPGRMIILAFVLVLLGFVVPFLMMIRFIESSFLLGFLSYGASVVGLFLGLIGAVWYTRMKRPRE